MYMFQFVHLSESKRKHSRFLKNIFNFYVTACTWFAASLLVNCQYVQNSHELVKNLIQIMHNTLIFCVQVPVAYISSLILTFFNILYV